MENSRGEEGEQQRIGGRAAEDRRESSRGLGYDGEQQRIGGRAAENRRENSRGYVVSWHAGEVRKDVGHMAGARPHMSQDQNFPG